MKTQQVSSKPFTDPGRAAPTKVSYAPASQETSLRVLLMKDNLLAKNNQLGLKAYAIAVASPDPEIFHVGHHHIYITEGLVRQCSTDGVLAAVLALELGRIVSEREAAVSDHVRQPERPLPIHLPIGSTGNARDADPTYHVELAQHEKKYPRQTQKLSRPNPHVVARDMLERAGYSSTDLDAAMPLLQNAERFRALETQFKGPLKQADWKVQ
jgi:predicted Zn-dependent protease